MQASGTSHPGYIPGMNGYGNNPSGFNAPTSSYGVNFAGFNPLQNWTNPSFPHRQPSIQFSQPSAMLANAPATSGSYIASTYWFPDSGASFHVTGDARNIQEPFPFDGPEQIFVGNGQGLDIQSSGSSVFHSPSTIFYMSLPLPKI